MLKELEGSQYLVDRYMSAEGRCNVTYLRKGDAMGYSTWFDTVAEADQFTADLRDAL